MVQLLTHCADNEFQLSTTLLLKTDFLVSKRNLLLNSFFHDPCLFISPCTTQVHGICLLVSGPSYGKGDRGGEISGVLSTDTEGSEDRVR